MKIFSTSPPLVHTGMKHALIGLWVLCGMSFCVKAQLAFSFNGVADFEVSKAGAKSHYYYNEIHQDHTGFRAWMSHLNLIGDLEIDSSAWSFHARVWLQRDKGAVFNKVSIPELNAQWLSPRRKLGFTFGFFRNPFGSFNEKQLSTQRNFIGLPLAYTYYTNISPNIGYGAGMGDINKTVIDEEVQWGSSQLYYGGYASGAMMSWNIKPGKTNLKLALVTGASNQQRRFTQPLNWGLSSRLKLQPAYYWEQGFSVSHGTFMQESEVSDLLGNLRSYTQTQLGTDIKLGRGFFEFSGEIIGALYRVPEFNHDVRRFENNGDALSLASLAAYLDVKYEPPFLQGSFVAYRLDHLCFSKHLSQQWDNRVRRHSLAIGYHLNKFLLARFAVSTQHVDNKPWDKTQNTFRLVLTAHY